MEVGQIVYIPKRHRNGDFEIQEVAIERIGRKYFYIKHDYRERPIDLNTLMYQEKDFGHNNFRVFLSKQEILDKEELQRLNDSIRGAFVGYGKSKYTLEQLRQVAAIINL